MTDISCDICMDLAPLVRDGLASEDSRRAVQAHIAHCDACRALLDTDLPAPDAQNDAAARIRRRIRCFELLVLICGILFGVSLTAGSNLFYNALLMPVIGALGYVIFRGYAALILPGMLLALHLAGNLIAFLRGVEVLDLWSVVLWTALYAVFAAVGVLIAWLLHFAFRKER
ncbi:MAG: zf-HC2 domain-containing protein [Clostridia bacterium]|nr:zf-HC2 domain-containing protein [Clostridia bacterium]